MEAFFVLDSNNGLSKEGIIPWNSKKDLNFLYKKTKNHVVIMGKNTYFSLPEDIRPLKNRLNIILTRQPNFFLNESFDQYKKTIKTDVIFTNNMNIHSAILNNREKFCTFYPSLSKNFKIFIIGGKQIYDNYIPLCKTIWVTRVKKCYSCDLTFEIDIEKQFKEIGKEDNDEISISKYIHL
jgi:dihydrofolate reductase